MDTIKNDNGKCYICKKELKKTCYVLDGKAICEPCYLNKHIAKEVKYKVKRVVLGV